MVLNFFQSDLASHGLQMWLIRIWSYTQAVHACVMYCSSTGGYSGHGNTKYSTLSTLVLNVKPIERQYICYSSARKFSAYNIIRRDCLASLLLWLWILSIPYSILLI